MQKLGLLIPAALVALALVAGSSASASGDVGPSSFVVGATDDYTLAEYDGGAAIYDQMDTYGLRAIRLSVEYRPSEPTTIQQQNLLERAIAAAAGRGFRVMLSIAPSNATDVAGDARGPQKFAAYAALLAKTFPDVKDFIIGNEPNLAMFWAPVYNGKGAIISAASYEKALAASYDALKAVDKNIDVIGLALSPRGDDRPGAARATISPVRFIKAVGDAYRASKRKKPIMDNVALHPYPNNNADPPERGYSWPNIGAVNVDRGQQAFWDAFHGTAQPTFQETRGSSGPGAPVRWVLDEAGWQSNTQRLPGYSGEENVPTVDEATQARYHAALVNRFECDSHVAALLFFHWVDETTRGPIGFQSGAVRADGTVKPAAEAVKRAVSGGCTGARVGWQHSSRIDGAGVTWKPKSGFLFFVHANEEATFTATAKPTKAAIARAKKAGKKLKPITLKRTLKAYVPFGVKLKGVTYATSRSYTFSVKMASTMNPARKATAKRAKLQKPDVEL